jgi:hypothetical protein
MAPDDAAAAEPNRHYRRVALLWIALAAVALLAAVIALMYVAQTGPFQPAPEPRL